MSDPRNAAHAKKVAQEKKHDGGGKPKSGSVVAAAEPDDTASGTSAALSASPTPTPPAALEGSLVVLAKLKDLEFHSRANLERLAELTLTVGDELKQTDIVGPLGEVYSAQNAFETKLTALIEAYKVECDRMQGERE
jgi:hypothetical protein